MHLCLQPVALISRAISYTYHRDAAPPIGLEAVSVWICVKSPFHGPVHLKSPLSRLVPDANSHETHVGHLNRHKSKYANKLYDMFLGLSTTFIARKGAPRSRMIPSVMSLMEDRDRNLDVIGL